MRFLEMDSPLCLGSSQVAKGICAAKVGCGDQTLERMLQDGWCRPADAKRTKQSYTIEMLWQKRIYRSE